MAELKKYLFNTIYTLALSILGFWVTSIWSDVKSNTSYSISHTKSIKTIEERLNSLENHYDKLPDVYVTRRELNVILGSIDTKMDNVKSDVSNISNDMRDINNKFDKLFEKIYEK